MGQQRRKRVGLLGQRSADDTVNALRDEFDLTPAGILTTLDLRRPIYELTTNYGHFGRQREEFTWERGATVG